MWDSIIAKILIRNPLFLCATMCPERLLVRDSSIHYNGPFSRLLHCWNWLRRVHVTCSAIEISRPLCRRLLGLPALWSKSSYYCTNGCSICGLAQIIRNLIYFLHKGNTSHYTSQINITFTLSLSIKTIFSEINLYERNK